MRALYGLFFLTIATTVAAQDSLKTRQLDEVVVTGQFEPQSLQKSVHRVRIIPAERIQAKGATRLQDVLNTELNIRFSQDLAVGGSNISMLGLSGQNVKVLIDGVPMIGRQGTSNAVDINQVNVNNIDRIEIIEGPMAVIYGADALAGVINIITKKPEQGKLHTSVRVHEETVGDEFGGSKGIHNENIMADYRIKNWYASGTLGRNAFGGWQGKAESRDKEWHPKTQWLGTGLIGFQNDRWNIYYRADYTDETVTDPGIFYGNEAIDKDFISTRLMHQIQATGKLNNKLSLNTSLAYTDFARETQTTTVNKTTGDVRLAIGLGLQDVTSFDGLTVRGTLQYKINEWVSLQPGIDINTESGSGDRLKEGANQISDYAGFVSADVRIMKRLNIRPGVRVLKNSVYNAPPAVPSINVKYDITDKQDLRFAYGRGFRAPSLRELYFSFFDASHSIVGNPNLEAELSHSLTGAWSWAVIDRENSKLYITTAVGGFYNDINNMITTGVFPGSTNTSYINIEKYKTKGITWTNTMKHELTEISAGFAYTGRFNQLTDQDKTLPDFTWTGEWNANISQQFTKAGLTASINYKYTGKTPFYELITIDNVQTVRLAKTDGYNWADVSLQKTILKKFVLAFGVRNLFNIERVNSTSQVSGAHTSTGARPIGYGRSFYTTITFNLNK